MDQHTQEIESKVEKIGEALKEGVQQVQERAGEFAEEGMEQAKKLQEATLDFVRERPVLSLCIVAGVSLGAGLLISSLLPRSDR
jgi:ElaB/YqjD/DUF883 family membrane-anchored ribosome-binding protein